MTATTDRPAPSVFEAGLPTVDYDTIDEPARVHDMLRAAREQFPIAVGTHGPEVLTYELVHAVLRDARFHIPPGFILAAQGITSGPLWDRAVASLLSLDGAEHHRLRRLVAKAFTPRATSRLHDTISDVLTSLVEPLTATGRCDVVADIARQYPIPVICALLGTDRGDWKLFSDWTDDVMKAFTWSAAEEHDNILRSWQELDDYLDDMIAARRSEVTDDLMTDLIRAEADGDRLTHDELLMLASGILMAGTDTTRNQVAAAVDTLCSHPEQWALLAEHPELAPGAVEEVLRHSPIAAATFRVADVDVELCGVTIPAGTLVVVNGASANRDPAVFDEPERFDITREQPASVMTFGGGVHYCLGSHLARAELVAALRILPAHMPNMRRAGSAPWKPLSGLAGPITLPVEFDAA
jgi:cytochrome P450